MATLTQGSKLIYCKARVKNLIFRKKKSRATDKYLTTWTKNLLEGMCFVLEKGGMREKLAMLLVQQPVWNCVKGGNAKPFHQPYGRRE